MISVDPSGLLLLAVPFVAVMSYITCRGIVGNEFRVPFRHGWATYSTWSLGWWSATLTNLPFLGASLFFFYQSLFHGADFSREPDLPLPNAAGSVIRTVDVERSPVSLARCLAVLNNGKVYDLGHDQFRVAIRNGRGSVMDTFDVTPQVTGSKLVVRHIWGLSLTRWERCFDPANDGFA